MQTTLKLITSITRYRERLTKGATFMNAKRIFAALIVAGILTTVAGAQYTAESYRTNGKKRDITGTWLVTITPGEPGAPSFDGLYTFTSDGVALFSSVGPPVPGLGNPGQGVWVRTGPNSFIATFKQFTFDDIFTTNGSLVIRSTITLTSDDNFNSSDTGQIFDLNGNEIVSLSGREVGRRMKIE